jgi:hypothetical protein
MRIFKSALVVAALSALTLPNAATAAASPSNSAQGQSSSSTNCWGVVSSQLAHVEGGIGDHASSQETPRLGLGNVARLFYDQGLIESPTLSALGSFLASLDEYDETVCPVE